MKVEDRYMAKENHCAVEYLVLLLLLLLLLLLYFVLSLTG